MINWNIRYSPILKRFPELFDSSLSILEVGSGDNGIASFLKRPVTALELRFGAAINPWLQPIVGSVQEIPVPDNHFDYVVCVDVLEHLAAVDRSKAIQELFRVARHKLVIACPCDAPAIEGERHLAALFTNSNLGVPSWLQEHLDIGLPTVGEILRNLIDLKTAFEVEGSEGLLQHYGGILLDHFLPYSKKLLQAHAKKASVGAAIEAGRSDGFYSYMFTIHKTPTESTITSQPDSQFYVSGSAPRVTGCTRDGLGLLQRPGSAALYCVQHRIGKAPDLGPVTPIYAGLAASSAPPESITDIPASVPPLDNRRWSELSAIYRIWQDGPRSTVIGFCHYRRLFAFNVVANESRERVVTRADLAALTPHFYDVGTIAQAEADTIIVPQPIVLDRTVWQQYGLIHYPQDWCIILGILSRNYPKLLPYALSHFESHQLYANNMFIMRWDRFDDLCTLWFNVLGEFVQRVAPDRGSLYQNRDAAFLAERLFDIWLRHQVACGISLIETPVYFVADARPAEASESA